MNGDSVKHPEYVNNSIVDGSSTYGGTFTFPRRNRVGGYWLDRDSTVCGSRGTITNQAGIYAVFHDS